MERIIFYILAAMMIIFAIAAVGSRKMLRSVIYLLFVLVGISGLFFLIDYNFLAAIQLTVYAGGIIVLIIFSVLLVHHIELRLELAKPRRQIATAILCLIGIGIVLTTIYSYDFQIANQDRIISTEDIGSTLLNYGDGGFILPFEVISVLLLAAMIGAIVIAKGKKLTENKESNS
ncbi:MAG: NADH-quinone oxidoreductase subunit J [Flavobacteriaceae bacterium]|nr:NADH-quinone oxidoreductase subunit J [Bacteroidia bacterium]MBT8287381.1 NADH-quinone oxidoreductase subunit J [Bacteroidia bacterium]NNF74016.1 NADH-quinone oxidoreductase subunit J [Flavobacteriaceae bacterium]NNK74104.1 NADH-quinone oxidoreductase subunit J [Flavobacteriaceae bacterium]